MQLQQDALQRLRFEKATGDIYFDGELFTGQVIYTGMLDELFNYSNGELPYRSLQFVLETLDEEGIPAGDYGELPQRGGIYTDHRV